MKNFYNFNNLISLADVMSRSSRRTDNLLSNQDATRQKDGKKTATTRQRCTMSNQGLFKKIALLLAVLTLSVGQMWGDAASWKNNTMSPSSYFTLGSNTSAATNAQTIGGTSYTHSINMTSTSGQSSNNTNGYFIRFTLTSASNVSILFKANGGSRTIRICTGWSYATSTNATQLANGATPTDGVMGTSASVANGSSGTLSVSNLAAGTYYICGSGSVSIFDISITAAATGTYYYRGADNSWGATLMTPSAGGTYEYRASSNNTHQFKIATTTDSWDYNYTYVDAGFYGTSSDIGDYSSDNCYIWMSGSYYIVVFKPNTAINTTNNPKICASATLPQDQFTISFNKGSGSGTMSSITSINAGSDQAVTANSFTAPSGYRFAGWKANVDVKVGGSTKTAGTVLADGVTIQSILSDITLTAQWEVIPTYDVTYNANSGGTGTTASQTGNLDAAQVTTRDNGFTPNSGKKFKWWNTASGGGGEDFYPGEKVTIDGADVALYAQWETVASNQEFWTPIEVASASSGKAISITEGDMSISSGGVTDAADINVDLTANATKVSKYSSTAKHAKVLAIKNDDKYIQVSFTDGSPINKLWLGTTTNSTDKKNLVVLYSTTADFSTGEYEKVTVKVNGYEQTSKAVFDFSPSTTDKYLYARIYRKISKAVYSQTGGDGATTRIYSIKAEKGVSCSTPAAPTGFSAGSISATGATFTITDAADAASYDIYYSTSGSAPEASTPATTTSTSKTKAVTGLTAATTYYAWVRSVCDASHKSAWVALNPGGDTHTFATSCVAPATVNVTATVNEVSGYWFYPGDDVVLTAAPTGSPAGSPVTYQWKKNGSNVGTNSATLAINDATASDAGKYTCTISYGECSTTSAEFSLKCMQFYLKNSGGSDISNHALTKVDATHATLSLSLTGGTTYNFRVTDGCNNWYGNSDATGMTSSNCTNWTMPHDADCKMTTNSKSATYTFNFDFSGGLLGSEMKVSVVYPAGDQAAGKVIYWDNNVLNWASAPWYRIGKGTHNNKTQMTLVPGTANLYKITTTEYNGFEYWHIANNEGEGTGNIFWTKDSDPATNEAITVAMGFEGSPVTAAAVTFTPTSSHGMGTSSDNDNCDFYEYGQQNGMKTDRVTISDYSNGTITVNYTNTSNVASTLTSGNADLAHTVILTSITAVANTGYDASAITINGGAYSANYVVTGATTIAASFTPHVYSITYKDQGNVAFSGTHTDTPSAHPTSHTYNTATNLNGATKAGYTFGGWYTSPDCSTGLVTSLGATDYTADITLYAKWTAAASLTAISADVLYQAANMANITFTGSDQYWAGLSTNNCFKTYGNGTSNSAKGKTITSTNVTDDIGTKSFTSHAFIEGSDVTSGTNDPTYGAIEFITPSTAGILYVYITDGSSSNLKLRKKGTSTFTALTGASNYKAVAVDASSNYYIHGNAGKRGLYGIQYVSTYSVTITPTKVTKETGDTGAGAAIKGKAYTATFTANTGYTLPSDVTVSIGGTPATKGTEYTWSVSDGTGTLTVNAANVTGNIVVNVTGETPSCTAHGLAYASTSVEKNVGDAAFTNALTNPNSLSVSYSSSNTGAATVNATSGLVSIVGAGSTTITATWAGDGTYCAGTATYTLTVSSDCTPQSLVKTQLTSTSAGTTSGYNDGEYAGDPVIASFQKDPIDGGYKMTGSAKLFVTLKKGNFVAGDKINIVITKASDLTNTVGKLPIFYNASSPTLLTTIDAASAGTYTYTLTDDDITTLGSNKTIGVFRSSGDTENNPYVKSVEVAGCREWATCEAPDAVVASGATHNSALLTVTDAAATGNYEFYYSTSSTAPTASTVALATGSALTKTITGLSASTTYYYWVRSNCGGVTKSAWVAGTPATFATTAAPSTYSVTYSATDKTSGSVPTDATAYEEGDIVTVKGNTGSLVKTGQTFLGWSTHATASSGTFYPAGYKFVMPSSNVTLYAVWGSAAEEKYYYGSITITAGALTPGSTGTKGFFTNSGGTIATSSAISLSSTPSEAGYYYESSTLTHTELNKSGNWNASSSSKRTIRAFKFKSGDSYTLALGSKVATSIMFYGKCGSASKTMSVGGQEYESPSTKEQFFSHEFTKVGNFTGNVTITQDGDFYGILVVTVSTGAGSNHTVSFNMNGHGSAIADIENVPDGSKIGAPVPEPTATDWDFGGWYNEEGCSSVFNFASTTITADKTLYAKWSNCAPTITTDPVAANYNQNDVASALTVEAATNGGGDLHYQWWVKENDLADEDGSAIPGETGISFTPSTALLGTSYYYCVVSNDCGNARTNTAAVTIRDTKPDPKAIWTVQEPTHGGKGFTFSVEVNKADDGNWDGTLEASMLTLSSEAVLDESSIVVNNTNKTISGTYGVKGSATSPVTFYLLLPATETQAAKRLDYDRSFDECVGGDGSTHDIRVLKANKNITFGGGTVYGWDNPGEGFLTASTGGTVSTAKAGTTMESVFDTVYNTNKKAFWVMPYAAGIKKIKVYGDVRTKEMVVSTVRKVTSFTSGKDANNIAFSAAYEGGGDNVASTGYHWFEITLDEALNANDIIYFTVSENFQISGVRVTEGTSSGSLYTSLEWSSSDATDGTVNKHEGDADFSITATRSGTYVDNTKASLGAISYSSSVPGVATVDAATGKIHIVAAGTTVIKATLAASGCYKKAEITYSLVVAEYVCAEKAGTVSIKTDNGCTNKILTVTGYEEGATTFQWYKDGDAIGGAMSQDYTATESGTYTVLTQKTCAVMSANSITLTFDAATATKIVDEWYVKNDRRTPDIALVQTTNATDFTVTNKSGGATVSDIGGCTFELKEDGIIYLHGTKANGDAPSDMTDGDITLVITAAACVNASPVEITIHRQEQRADGKPSVAFVVDGTLRKDGGTATSVLAAKTSDRPIWKYLENTFYLTGCNAYWSVDSKELRQYYSQFDAILITDDPSTDTKGTGGVSYVKAFGTMVDVRPVLTLEAYVGKFKDGGWHVYDATPTSPNPRQVEMKLECKNHDIFKGLDPAASANVRTTTDEYGNEYWHVIMVDTTQSPYHNTKSDYEALPALQGFDKTKFSNMLGVGTIFGEKLQAGVERQEEPAARMMILGVQNNAMAALTNEGKLVIKNALEYLLKTNMEDVNDCSNYFTNADGDSQWGNGANWTRGEVPDFETRARILKPVIIGDGTTAIAARVDIAASGESKHVDGECTGKVTINPTGALIVGGKIRRADAPRYGIDDLMPTENSDLIVKASTTAPHNQGALIFNNTDGDTHAVVEMWNPSYWEVVDGKKKKYWSYVAVPIQEADIPNFFWYGFTYLYDETSGWIKKGDGTVLYPFQGIGASLQTGNMETFYGPLATTESQDIALTVTAEKGQGMNLIGNSWTAPIQIANFEEDDFGDAAAEVWVFNTGNKNDGTPGSGSSATAGQWNAIPINAAGLPGYTGLKVIPAMQAFEVNTTSETTLHLDYDRLVRAGRENLNEPMRAPKRTKTADKQIEATMRVRVTGEKTHTDVYLLQDKRFTDTFDNGWDGHYLSGDDRSARLYAISNEEGAMAFLAQPVIDGTLLGFAPSREGDTYTFSFSYDGEETLYLNDSKLQESTLINDENTYLFSYEAGDAQRFIISSVPYNKPGVTTGTETILHPEKVQKVIYNNHVYIIRGGRVYDVVGKMVK